jgi:predicted enzyme related to lactoylglutathione lyase
MKGARVTVTIKSITIDCERPAPLARFWAGVLGYRVRPYDDDEIARLRAHGIDDVEDDPSVAIDPPDDGGPVMFFTKVPEPKAVKNRVHLDLRPQRDMDEEVQRVLALGATVVHVVEEDGRRWTVMADPEGNEFCVEQI